MTKDDPNIARAEAKIQELTAEFLKLEPGAREKGTDAEARFNQAASEFEKNRASLEKSLKELESSSDRTVKEKEKGVDRALEDLEETFKKSKYQFS